MQITGSKGTELGMCRQAAKINSIWGFPFGGHFQLFQSSKGKISPSEHSSSSYSIALSLSAHVCKMGQGQGRIRMRVMRT